MKINRLFFALALSASLCCGGTAAQERGDWDRNAGERRIEILAERMERELMLDDEVAPKFTSLYKDYLNALYDCRRRGHAEGETWHERRLERRRMLLEVEEDYYAKFKEILNRRQLERLFSPRHYRHGGDCCHYDGGRRRGHCCF